jgi:hypothetical protein
VTKSGVLKRLRDLRVAGEEIRVDEEVAIRRVLDTPDACGTRPLVDSLGANENQRR